MKTLPSSITNLKNQLAVGGAWVTTMDIYYPNYNSHTVDHHFINDNIALGIWLPASFQIQQITEEVQMSLPKITITIYDPELDLKDDFQDNAGMSGGTVVLQRMYRATETIIDVDIRQEFTILDVAMADTIISLSVGVADPLARRFPRDNYGALTCRHKYKGGFCRYDGNLIVNPSFENVAISPWQRWGLPTIYWRSDDQHKFGSYSLHTRSSSGVYATSHNQGMQQTFTVRPNTQYNLSCWIYRLNVYTATQTIRAMTYVDGEAYHSALSTVLNTWEQVSLTITTAADQTSATVWLGGIGEAYFDGLEINLTYCTHTLEDAPDETPGCRSHNNSHQFGGSPGAAEGIFYNR